MNRPTNAQKQLLELIQMSVGVRETFSREPSDEVGWQALLKEVAAHRLMGVSFPVIEQLFIADKVPTGVYGSWLVMVGRIRELNERQRKGLVTVYRFFEQNGFRSCVLKGQASGLLYPDPLLRQSGDIDIWVEGGRDEVLNLLKAHFEVQKTRYIHSEVNMLKGMRVEVHYTPSWMFSPFANIRLQRWFASHAEEQFTHYEERLEANVPTLRFNGSYMLLHIYRHLLEEGIGLRQVMDYYYVLLQMDQDDRDAVWADIRHLGLARFCGALMEVLSVVFAIKEEYMLCSPSRRRGRILLEAILRSGNFGLADPIFANKESKSEGILAHGWRKIKRNVHFLLLAPREVLAMPFHVTWQYFWRRKHGYLYHGR